MFEAAQDYADSVFGAHPRESWLADLTLLALLNFFAFRPNAVTIPAEVRVTSDGKGSRIFTNASGIIDFANNIINGWRSTTSRLMPLAVTFS